MEAFNSFEELKSAQNVQKEQVAQPSITVHSSFNELMKSQSVQEQQCDVQNATWNTGVVHEFEGLKFSVGPEGAGKRKHIHVKSSEGEVKFWLELNNVPRIDVDEDSKIGDVESFEKEALEQIQVYYGEIVANIDRYYNKEPIQKTIGKKTKGKNSPKAVAARKSAEAAKTEDV